MELNRCVTLQYPEYKVPWFHEQYCNQNIKTVAYTQDTNIKKEVRAESVLSLTGVLFKVHGMKKE